MNMLFEDRSRSADRGTASPRSLQDSWGVQVTCDNVCSPAEGKGRLEKNGPSITVTPTCSRAGGIWINASSVTSCLRGSRGSPDRASSWLIPEYVQLKTY